MAGKNPLFQGFAGIIVANIREHMMKDYITKLQGATEQGLAVKEAAQKVAELNAVQAEELGMSDPMMVAAQAEMLDAETKAKALEHTRQKDAAEIAIKGMDMALKEKKETTRSKEKQQDTGMKMVQASLNNMQSLAQRENSKKEKK